MLIHLSETGVNAGRRLCGAAPGPENRSVHAVYAPLGKQEFRDQVCTHCMRVWAQEAYEPGDDMPDYIKELRAPMSHAAVEQLALAI